MTKPIKRPHPVLMRYFGNEMRVSMAVKRNQLLLHSTAIHRLFAEYLLPPHYDMPWNRAREPNVTLKLGDA